MDAVLIFGQNVRKAREKMNMSIVQLAEKACYNRFDLSTLENGEHDISLGTAVDIAKALDRDFPTLLSRNFKVDEGDHFIENNYLSLFVENVEFMLQEKNKFQYSISSRTGIAPENVNRILKKHIVPKIGTIENFADALDIEFMELFRRKGGEAQ
ncbi:MAG: helix-turn-helix transcriptional regulator [Lachnospiraceae bacterium]